MTPVYLNPPPPPSPFVELKEEQYFQLSLSVPQQAASWLSVDHHPTFFNTAKPEESNHDHHHKVNKCDGGSGDRHQASSSSSLQYAVDHSAANCHQHLSFSRKEDGDSETASDHNNGSSVKWMPSKTRLMKKMMKSNCSTTTGSANHNKAVKFTSKFQYLMHDGDETNSFGKTSNTIRACSNCNTTTTPLWRSGPRGPKSLCNACGIRQRKARRAMEAATSAAANGAAVATGATISMKIKVHNNKELKKPRTTSHAGQYKKHHQFKAAAPSSGHNSHYQQNQEKLCFKEFALSLNKNSALQRVFPQDVEDAAILLMELSCGLVHS